jgi:hypothetical protein
MLKSKTVNLAKNIRAKLTSRKLPWQKRTSLADDMSGTEGTKKPVLLEKFVSWCLVRFIQSNTHQTDGLKISVAAGSNKNVMKGDIGTIEMKFDSLQHSHFLVSGGGTVTVEGLQLRIRRLLFHNLPSIARPYKMRCELNLTQDDIFRSQFIRSLIQGAVDSVLARVLNTKSILNMAVTAVTIKGNRIVAKVTLTVLEDSPISVSFPPDTSKNPSPSGLVNMDFEVSTRLGVRENNPSMLYLQDLAVTANPETILMRTQLPIPSNTAIDVDLGAECRIERLVIADEKIAFAASAVISPVRAFSVTPASAASRTVATSSGDNAYSTLTAATLAATQYSAAFASAVSGLFTSSLVPTFVWPTTLLQYDLCSALSATMRLNGGWLTARLPWAHLWARGGAASGDSGSASTAAC